MDSSVLKPGDFYESHEGVIVEVICKSVNQSEEDYVVFRRIRDNKICHLTITSFLYKDGTGGDDSPREYNYRKCVGEA